MIAFFQAALLTSFVSATFFNAHRRLFSIFSQS